MDEKQPPRRRMFIGVYNPSVIVTYLGVVATVVGTSLAVSGNARYAVVCLIAAGLCDVFDGKIARRCRRNQTEKLFGVQIDSLADVAAFCLLPVVIFSSLGFNQWYHLVAYSALMIAGITRLGLFNLDADENAPVSYYTGLPVTTTALIFPIVYVFAKQSSPVVFGPALGAIILIVAGLFIANIKIKKPTGVWYGVFGLLAAGLTFLILNLRTA